MKRYHRPDDPYRGVPVLVLGAGGFIGRWVARALTSAGADLCVAVRDAGRADGILSRYGVRGKVMAADLTNPESIRSLLLDARPTVLFNLAAYGVDPSERDEKAAYQMNADLIRTICQTLVSAHDTTWPGQQFVHVGSALEYGSLGGDLSEDSQPRPNTLYGKSKLLGTQYMTECCRNRALRGMTARLFTVYGPGEHSRRLLPSLLEAANKGLNLDLTSGGQRRDFTYVEDVADGLLRLGVSTSDVGEVVNLATGRLTTVREFALTAAEVCRITPKRLEFGRLPTRPEEMEHTDVNLDRLKRLTDWVPPTEPEDGIRETVAFCSALRGC